ncbi:MAG: hypothetical protein IPO21_01310 [Bacteroidales bacterium]|nr:hypothetical protein [Bacteroidales bacterium]
MGDLRTTGAYWKGGVAEILAFSAVLTTIQREEVEQYIKSRYAQPVKVGGDIVKADFCDTVIRAGENFVSYLWNTGATRLVNQRQ